MVSQHAPNFGMDENAGLTPPQHLKDWANIVRTRYGGAFADCTDGELIQIIAEPYWALQEKKP